ncbi:hypothetical protein BU24DRAFT_419859 [Aaosphaeria arxii CBS 175.79]|uniref:Rhodopsin domain-containing protein n=1 Tax=Aaosphaeria arxii CBS 175.79 TaxID=1450172 RepID=A0A6A5Y6Y2_9PLEO|nr:uncharacterized protein BU24DRAFT_419859 [Aaosphaeria arxii CBS 175.79]KAF2020314.1 hypothetical protein BU24DRAFT_419859 [Aaosphaeria arxii CBS 175.79]
MAPTMHNFHQWHTRAIEEGSKQMSMFAVAISFIIITTFVMGVRLHVRLNLVQGGLGLDDILMLVGTIFNLALSAANMICAYYGAGKHTANIPPEDFEPLLKSNLAVRLLYLAALCLVKLSILVFYLRLDHRKFTKYAIYFLIFTVCGLSAATLVILLIICMPTSLYWDVAQQALHPEKCWDLDTQQVFYNAHGILNIIQDAAIYVLPMPMLWKLQIPKRQKVALVALLCVGFVAVAAGCVRFYYVLFLADEADMWWYMADSLNWCSIEIHVAIICGCASTFKVMFKTYLPGIWGNTMGGSGNPRHQYNQSHSGQFALKPFSNSSTQKSSSNRKYGVGDLTTVGYGSEENIVKDQPGQPGQQEHQEWENGIKMSKDVTIHISEAASNHSNDLGRNAEVRQSRIQRGW